jgi:hypothetical protein
VDAAFLYGCGWGEGDCAPSPALVMRALWRLILPDGLALASWGTAARMAMVWAHGGIFCKDEVSVNQPEGWGFEDGRKRESTRREGIRRRAKA